LPGRKVVIAFGEGIFPVEQSSIGNYLFVCLSRLLFLSVAKNSFLQPPATLDNKSDLNADIRIYLPRVVTNPVKESFVENN